MINDEPPPASDSELAKIHLQAQSQRAARQQEFGKMGSLFGSRDNAVVYLAVIVIILAIIGSVILAIIDPTLRGDMSKTLAALAIAALGYMFGQSGRNSS
jgi:hypothetical protein